MSLLDLLERAQAGDRDAQETVFREYYSAVLSLVKARMGRFLRSHEESEDVAQSVFRQVMGSEAFASLKVGDAGAFQRWLRRVVDNKLADHVRVFSAQKRAASRAIPLGTTPGGRDGGLPIAERQPSPPDSLDLEERAARLHAALPRLPTTLHREVVRLHYLDSVPTSEIARRLAIDPRKVRRLRAEAIALLAGLLGERHESSPSE